MRAVWTTNNCAILSVTRSSGLLPLVLSGNSQRGKHELGSLPRSKPGLLSEVPHLAAPPTSHIQIADASDVFYLTQDLMLPRPYHFYEVMNAGIALAPNSTAQSV